MEGAKTLRPQGVHKATQTDFQHIKVVPNPPDICPPLQHCVQDTRPPADILAGPPIPGPSAHIPAL